MTTMSPRLIFLPPRRSMELRASTSSQSRLDVRHQLRLINRWAWQMKFKVELEISLSLLLNRVAGVPVAHCSASHPDARFQGQHANICLIAQLDPPRLNRTVHIPQRMLGFAIRCRPEYYTMSQHSATETTGQARRTGDQACAKPTRSEAKREKRTGRVTVDRKARYSKGGNNLSAEPRRNNAGHISS